MGKKREKRKAKRKLVAQMRDKEQSTITEEDLQAIREENEAQRKLWEEREREFQQELQDEKKIQEKIEKLEDQLLESNKQEEQRDETKEGNSDLSVYGPPNRELADFPLIDINTLSQMKNDRSNCGFYLRCGVCQYGVNCRRNHPIAFTSTVLLFHNMFESFIQESLNQNTTKNLNLLEILQPKLTTFLDDTIPEFTKYGTIAQLKVSCNFSKHLKGNVYVEYGSAGAAKRAKQGFQGRFYASSPLYPQFVPILQWKDSLCNSFEATNTCPNISNCHFLHCIKYKYIILPTSQKRRSKGNSPPAKRARVT